MDMIIALFTVTSKSQVLSYTDEARRQKPGQSARYVGNKKKYTVMKTYDVVFHDAQDSNNKGFANTLQEAISYIENNNGSNISYFEDYKAGTVSVVCNQTNETVYETEVK